MTVVTPFAIRDNEGDSIIGVDLPTQYLRFGPWDYSIESWCIDDTCGVEAWYNDALGGSADVWYGEGAHCDLPRLVAQATAACLADSVDDTELYVVTPEGR